MTDTMPAPPAPPAPDQNPTPPRGSGDGWWRSIALAVVVAGLLGIAVAGGSLFEQAAGTNAEPTDAMPYALGGALAGLAIAVIGVVAYLRLRPGAQRPSLWVLLAIGFIAAVLGALVGAALTPEQKESDDVSPLSEQEMERRRDEYGDIPEGGRAGPVDRDGDGEPDTDANGDPIIGYDRDGDGQIDGYLRPCPPNSPEPEVPPELRAAPPGRPAIAMVVFPAVIAPPDDGGAESERRLPRGAIDYECDGVIDAIIEYDDELLQRPFGQGDPNAPLAPPDTIAPDERQERADQQNDENSDTGGFLLKLLVIVAIIAAVAAVVVWLLRRANRDEPVEPVDEEPAEPEINQSVRASIDDLIADPDPRQGILAAYGRLLTGFADLGMPRMPHEAPEEHLERCLATTHLPADAARELAEWFGLARFSPHPIDESHRTAAVGALRRFLDEAPAAPEPVFAAPPAPGSPE